MNYLNLHIYYQNAILKQEKPTNVSLSVSGPPPLRLYSAVVCDVSANARHTNRLMLPFYLFPLSTYSIYSIYIYQNYERFYSAMLNTRRFLRIYQGPHSDTVGVLIHIPAEP